ncbi:MAG: penicillin-binding protein activator [Ignavibacteriales bacterium]|nr:penicillin-binding protein activator [Ignavibacteriales bacterium]
MVIRSATLRAPLFLLLLGCTVPAAAGAFQIDSLAFRPDVERVFVDAMRHFSASRFDSAAALFMRCLKEFPTNHRTTGASIMAGKTYYRLGNYRESVRVLKNFIDLFPESNYVPDAHYSLGLDYFRMLRYEDSAAELVVAHQVASDATLRERAEKLLDEIAASYLTIAQMQLLLGNGVSDPVRVLLTVRLAERIYQTGDIKSAQDILRPVASFPPSILYVQKALELLERIEVAGELKVGVLVPLMLKAVQPSQRDLGVELLNGMKQAVEEYNQVQLPKIDLEVRDSERDPSVAARLVTELCSDENVVAIVGPVFSNEAFACAGIANAKSVPMLTPTATANGIASIGPYVFQLNPDYDVRGRSMARFAFDRGARRFAVLSPAEQIPKSMADAFLDEVQKLGGEIIDVQWYATGATDLRIQLSTMRQRALDKTEPMVINFASKMSYEDLKKLLILGVPSRLLDSLVERGAIAPVEELLGPDGKILADSLKIPTERGIIKYDSLAMPVTNVDAIFLPIATSDEIGIVTSQLRYFNFQTQLLGTGEWNDLAYLDQNREYSNGVVYSYDTYVEEADPAYKIFTAKYQQLYGRKPTTNSLFGYDSMKLLLEVIAGGSARRNDIAASLVQLRRARGIHTSYSIGESRVNSFLTLLRFERRAIQKIGEIDLSEPEEEPVQQTTR